jgi:hypothetical protein
LGSLTQKFIEMLFELRTLLNQVYNGRMSVTKNLFAVSHKLGIPKEEVKEYVSLNVLISKIEIHEYQPGLPIIVQDLR